MYYLSRLRDLRQDHDLKQKEVAALLKIDQRVYSTYETGKREIPLRHLADSIYRRCAAQSHKGTEAQAIASAAVSIRLSHRGPRVKPICPAYRLLPRRGPQAH